VKKLRRQTQARAGRRSFAPLGLRFVWVSTQGLRPGYILAPLRGWAVTSQSIVIIYCHLLSGPQPAGRQRSRTWTNQRKSARSDSRW